MKKKPEQLIKQISHLCDSLSDVRIMEICGTHTMSFAMHGLRATLPKNLRLLSGPGCPVCVTEQTFIDGAIYLLRSIPDITIATYGDMVRVPGSEQSLSDAASDSPGKVEVVYSAENAVALAKQRPAGQVVFLGVGFETTAPGTALAIKHAARENVENFSVLTAHKTVPQAMRTLLSDDEVKIDAFLCPGHVSIIIGWGAYEEIAAEHHRPCVVAGFDPSQMLGGICKILRQLAEGKYEANSIYPPVQRQANAKAMELLDEVFQPVDAPWRGIGTIPQSGLAIREKFSKFDAEKRFDIPVLPIVHPKGCRCGDVLCGKCMPTECGLFGKKCTPEKPIGPCMVSSEGACAATYKYGT